MIRALRVGASHVTVLAAVVGGLLLTGETPGLIVFAYLLHQLLRLLLLGALDRALRTGGEGARRFVIDHTRSPAPGALCTPIRDGDVDGPPSGLATYVFILAVLGVFLAVMMYAETDGETLRSFRAGWAGDLAWGALYAALYAVQDLVDRRLTMDVHEPFRVNLGYNSSGVVIVSLVSLGFGFLTRHLGPGWSVAAPLLALKHLADLRIDARDPGPVGRS